MTDNNPGSSNGPSTGRRRFMISSALTGTVPLLTREAAARATTPVAPTDVYAPVYIEIQVNGSVERIGIDARMTLLDALREQIGLTGTKKGCDHGQCGACTVLIEGQPELSCLTLAMALGPREVTTIEGLSKPDGSLHPMQQAFIDHDAFQCGYCTSGQIIAAIGCVQTGHAGTAAEIREYMSGNICRCAAYPNITAAISQARDEMGSES